MVIDALSSVDDSEVQANITQMKQILDTLDLEQKTIQQFRDRSMTE